LEALMEALKTDEYARDFGHCLAMMGLCAGVSWFDNHARFDRVRSAASGIDFGQRSDAWKFAASAASGIGPSGIQSAGNVKDRQTGARCKMRQGERDDNE
jgi:hypothetical protein